MKRDIFKIFIFITIIGLILLGCSGKEKGGPIKIGVAGPYTGDLAAYGIPTSEAVKILADKINADGGINGSTIELVVEDDQCDPNTATLVASKLVGEEVVAVVGHICSGATASALPTYQDANIPVISPSATNPDLADNFPNFFRTIADDSRQGVRQAEFLVNNLNVKKVVIIHDGGEYGKGLADSSKAQFETYGTEIALYEGVTAGAVDYSATVSKIIKANPDALVYGGYDADGSKLLGQLREKGYKGIFIAGDGFKGQNFIKLAGKNAEGAYATGPKDYTGLPLYKEVKAEYAETMGGDPGTFYFEGYAAAMVIVEAIKAGNTTPEAILKYLKSSPTVDTPLGEISFEKNGNSKGTGFDVYQVVNGDFQIAN